MDDGDKIHEITINFNIGYEKKEHCIDELAEHLAWSIYETLMSEFEDFGCVVQLDMKNHITGTLQTVFCETSNQNKFPNKKN